MGQSFLQIQLKVASFILNGRIFFQFQVNTQIIRSPPYWSTVYLLHKAPLQDEEISVLYALSVRRILGFVLYAAVSNSGETDIRSGQQCFLLGSVVAADRVEARTTERSYSAVAR
jgi:hypothetical protein